MENGNCTMPWENWNNFLNVRFVKIPFHDYRHIQMGDIMRSTQNIYKNLIVYTLNLVKQIKKSCVSSKYVNKQCAILMDVWIGL